MSREFWQSAVQTVENLVSAMQPAQGAGGQQQPNAATAQAEAAAQAAEAQEVEEVCQPCDDKWLVITIERHTKHEFGGRWDCTVGDLKMEIWDEEDSGSGALVFDCKTSERGGPANANFDGESNTDLGSNYTYYNQYMIMPSDNYGLSAHRSGTGKYYTYGYNTNYLDRARPGIAIYGSGSGAMDRRSGVLIHAGTHHRWSVGCIVLHTEGTVSGSRYTFDKTSSVNTLLKFLRKIHEFAGESRHTIAVKIPKVKLIVKESF